MKINVEKSTYWFLITALCNLIYSPIVHFFLNNPNLGERFKGMHVTFYVSYIYISIGLIWLVFGGLYLIADNAQSFKFTATSKKLHFFLTLGFVLGLMLVPVLDTFHIATHGNGINLFLDILTLFLPPILFLAFFVGIVIFLASLIKALVSLIAKK
jgi:hypothetical protein